MIIASTRTRRGEHVARVRLAVQQLPDAAALADHSSEATWRLAEQFTVRVDHGRGAVAVRHEVFGLLDSVREVRRRDVELAHTRVQQVERVGVAGRHWP
ncbi:hypothetical protein [Streptomyces hawaiiensis]|uniref:hypothetical protein n=1 Tax=Streptomyces hawaiiensis TaxID=67305 RepID=UPI001586E24A|nr:hypothetical protein [Streptomyces hawaiiensis]